jgi:cytochrome oxidase assembly protein ShyY1
MIARSEQIRSLAGLGIFSVVIVGLLLGLGFWQLQRRVEKHALIAALDERLAAAPVALPDAAQWPAWTPADNEFRRVTFQAQFETQPDGRVFASGSAIRPDVTVPGMWVFNPVRLASGATVVINRGFVPETEKAEVTPPPSRPVTLTGYIRFPETEGMLTPHEESSKRLWFLRDQRAMAKVLGWGEVAPFYIDLETPAPANGLPKPGPLQVHLKDDHMQYAITWFGLAAAVAIAFGVWVARTLADGKDAPENKGIPD